MFFRLGVISTFSLEPGANAIDGGGWGKRHETAGHRFHRHRKTRRIRMHAMYDELKGAWELGPRGLARIVEAMK